MIIYSICLNAHLFKIKCLKILQCERGGASNKEEALLGTFSEYWQTLHCCWPYLEESPVVGTVSSSPPASCWFRRPGLTRSWEISALEYSRTLHQTQILTSPSVHPPANQIQLINKYRVSKKKTGISNKMAITTWKSIRKGKSWCVSENSA